ncbi:hypothetical protein T459_04586 [Capsicum annuum]|uniref:Replication protein A 70 kDa DNA-binding subunit B-like n=1 Tax=Capsicum annuum TaxID=4072 RepID=A0A2G3A5K2_CAPAN|nr:hypothetical protein T459_04586 [Capsicum annuum]
MKLAAAKVKIPSKEELSPCLSSTDELVEEQQVSIILYGDDIPKYENLFGLFETYLVSCTKVREPRNYLIRAAMYEWVADRYTIVEAVTNNNGSEVPLLAPTKLDTLSFSAIEEQRPGVEFDLLAVVVNCSAIQYTTDQSKHFREAIVIDQSKKPFLFTIWGDLADNEGATLLHHLHEYPVILARRIDVTEFHSALRLATRYQSTILTNPQYVQATALTNWCYFKVNIIDASDTITVMISETLGERMLSLTSEQIYELVAVQHRDINIVSLRVDEADIRRSLLGTLPDLRVTHSLFLPMVQIHDFQTSSSNSISAIRVPAVSPHLSRA